MTRNKYKLRLNLVSLSRLEHPLRAMSLVSWGVERLTRFSLSLYLFRVIWLNVYKVLLCLHCWGITTIRCPSMLAHGLANNNLVCILCSEDGLLSDHYTTEVVLSCVFILNCRTLHKAKSSCMKFRTRNSLEDIIILVT